METVDLSGRRVGLGEPCLLIAEIGVNHNGDPATALSMVDAIADAGVECVKFQTFRAAEFVNSTNETYTYESQGVTVTESMLEMFKRLELAHEAFSPLFARARARGLLPLSTPTDRDAVDLLDELDVPAFKIGSDDLVYTALLRYVARKGRPMVISAGMANEYEIEKAIDTINAEGNDQIILLHCVSEYPTPPTDANLRKIPALAERFGVPVGFSDHMLGITAALAAVALGACVIEKHMTLDRSMPGPDHHFSADPPELRELVARVHEVESCLGSADLVPTRAERDLAELCRRSIVAATDLEEGHVIDGSDLAYRRPGTGLLPTEADRLIGSTVRRSLRAGGLIGLDDVQRSE